MTTGTYKLYGESHQNQLFRHRWAIKVCLARWDGTFTLPREVTIEGETQDVNTLNHFFSRGDAEFVLEFEKGMLKTVDGKPLLDYLEEPYSISRSVP